MPRLLATRWTRFHVAGSEQHPAGRTVEFAEHPDLKGPEGGPIFFADISQEEAEHLVSDEHDLVKPMGWSISLTDDEKSTAAKKLVKQAASDKQAASGGAKE